MGASLQLKRASLVSGSKCYWFLNNEVRAVFITYFQFHVPQVLCIFITNTTQSRVLAKFGNPIGLVNMILDFQ